MYPSNKKSPAGTNDLVKKRFYWLIIGYFLDVYHRLINLKILKKTLQCDIKFYRTN